MNHDWYEPVKKGFSFSGKMTASATHEIKNSLAVIKENAGLLNDIALISDKEHPLSPEKMITISQRITKHVDRVNETVINMNRLAHSTDRFKTSVNIVDTLNFLKTITSRLTNNKGVKINITSTKDDIVLVTSPFLLKQLVWECICFLMDEMSESYEIEVNVAGNDNSVIIFFLGMSVSEKAFKRFTSNEANTLKHLIDSDITQDEKTGNIVLVIKNSSF